MSISHVVPFPDVHKGHTYSDATFWLVWYNLLIQTGSNSSKQTWFLVSWLQHSKLNWFELTSKGQMKYLSTGTQSKACYQWHNPNHLDCVTTTMYGDQNPNWYLDCVSSVNPLDSDPSNTFGLWHPCPLVCVGTNSLDSVSFPFLGDWGHQSWPLRPISDSLGESDIYWIWNMESIWTLYKFPLITTLVIIFQSTWISMVSSTTLAPSQI